MAYAERMTTFGTQPAPSYADTVSGPETALAADPKLEEIIAGLSDRFQHLQALNNRLREINAKISGTEPEPCMDALNGGNGPKEGYFREWAAIWLHGLRCELATLDLQVSRLERSL